MSAKITALSAITGASVASTDLAVLVDVSDTTMAATGTDKNITIAELLIGLQALPLAGGTMTGTLTIGTGSTLDINLASTTGGFLFRRWTASASYTGIYPRDVAASDTNYILLVGPGGDVYWNGGSGAIVFRVANTDTVRVNSGYFAFGTSTLAAWGTSFTAKDTALGRNAAGVVEVNNGTAGTYAAILAKEFRFAAPTSANGQYLAVKSLTELLTIAAAATSTTTIQKPANSIILGVSVRVTTAITCTSTFTVGDSGSATRFSTAAVSKAVNSTDAGTKAGAYYNATAEGIVITPDTTPTDATGRVRVTIHYLEMQAPTS